jgi:hypothetical protein
LGYGPNCIGQSARNVPRGGIGSATSKPSVFGFLGPTVALWAMVGEPGCRFD